MAETEKPVAEAPPPPASSLTSIIGGVAALTVIASACLLTAVAGAAHAPGAGQTYALAAIAGIVVVTLVIPAGIGGWGLTTLRRRGIKIRVVRTVAGLTFLWNAAILGIAASIDKPWTSSERLTQNVMWVPLAAMNKTPMDEAALPAVAMLTAEAVTVPNTRELSAMLTNESAAGLAVKWLRIRDNQLAGDRVAQLYTMFGIDRNKLVETPKSLEAELVPRGRDLLYEVSEIVDLGADSHLKWWDPTRSSEPIDELAASFAAEVIDNEHIMVRVDDHTNLDAVLEDGSWRLHLADYAELVGEDRAAAKADPADADPEAIAAAPTEPEAPAESEEHTAVRLAFQRAAAGRAGHLATTTAFDSSWPDTLTHEAAAATGLEVLGWCVGPALAAPSVPEAGAEATDPAAVVHDAAEALTASADPIFDREYQSLASDYGLALGAFEMTDPLTATLVPRGRAFMVKVLEICGPVKRRRQVEQSRAGFAVPDTRRMRWAELDAGDLAERATIEDAGVGAKKITVDGIEFAAQLQDGRWRITP